MTNETLEMLHIQCVDSVMKNDYYVNTFFATSKYANLEELRDMKDCLEIVSFWNNFWFALPDSANIHRKPFDLICDICKYDYREDDEQTN